MSHPMSISSLPRAGEARFVDEPPAMLRPGLLCYERVGRGRSVKLFLDAPGRFRLVRVDGTEERFNSAPAANTAYREDAAAHRTHETTR